MKPRVLVLHTDRLVPLLPPHVAMLDDLLIRESNREWDVRWQVAEDLTVDDGWYEGGPYRIVCMNATLPDRLLAEEATYKHLQGVVKLGRYVQRLPLDVLEERAVPVVIVPDQFAISCAEQAVALTLTLMRRICALDEEVRSGNNPLELRSIRTNSVERRPNWLGLPVGALRTVFGTVVGIVGLGEIGLETATRFVGLGATVLYTKRERLPAATEKELGIVWTPFYELLTSADVVSLHVPFSPETEHLFGEREFGSMKASALIVNTARGGLVDEEALAQALRTDRLGGAGLDVFVQEPLPVSSPLLDAPRVVLSPHVGVFPAALEERYRPVARALIRMAESHEDVS